MINNKSNVSVVYSNTKWVMIGKFITQFISLIALVFVIRKLEVDIFGTFNFLLTVFLLFQVFGLSPFTAVIKRYVPELLQVGDYRGIQFFLKYVYLISTAIFFLLAFIIYIYSHELGEFFNITSLNNYIVPTLVYVFFQYYERISTTVLQSVLLNKELSKINIFASLFKTFLYFVFLEKLNINILLAIEVSYSIIVLLFSVIVIKRYLSKQIQVSLENGLSPSRLNIKRVLRYGAFSFLSEFGQGALGRSSDIFIVSAISNPIQVGLYAFGNRVYSMFYKIIPARELMSVIRPMFINKFSNGAASNDFLKMYNFIIKLLLPLYVTPAMYFFVFGENIIAHVFDVRYSDAYFVTLVLLSSNIFHGVFVSQGITIELLEKVEIKFYTQAITFISVFIGIYAMKNYGIDGLALVTSGALALKYIIMQLFLRKHINIEYDVNSYIKYIAIYLIMTVVFIPANGIIDSVGLLLLFSILYGITLLFLIYVICPFNDYDKDIITKIAVNSTLFRVFLNILKG